MTKSTGHIHYSNFQEETIRHLPSLTSTSLRTKQKHKNYRIYNGKSRLFLCAMQTSASSSQLTVHSRWEEKAQIRVIDQQYWVLVLTRVSTIIVMMEQILFVFLPPPSCLFVLISRTLYSLLSSIAFMSLIQEATLIRLLWSWCPVPNCPGFAL